jgi:RNA polymerase sigma-70 factor, ECF subfamily
MSTPVVQGRRRAAHLRFGSAPADAPPPRRSARPRTTPEHVLDPQALGDHFDRLFRVAWALCGSREDAEDLVQGTYARVLARPRVVRNGDDLGYLLRAVRNTFISQRRAATRRPQAAAGAEPEALDLPDPRTGAEPPAAAEAREVFTAIAALPANSRDTLVAIDVAGLSYGEAAKALHVREATITTRLFRARSQVAKSLTEP